VESGEWRVESGVERGTRTAGTARLERSFAGLGALLDGYAGVRRRRRRRRRRKQEGEKEEDDKRKRLSRGHV